MYLQEHAANTGVGLRFDTVSGAAHALLVTADGHDGSTLLDPTSGINARQLADFMIHQVCAG